MNKVARYMHVNANKACLGQHGTVECCVNAKHADWVMQHYETLSCPVGTKLRCKAAMQQDRRPMKLSNSGDIRPVR